MADIADLRSDVQIEETRFRFAVSESFAQKLGGSINFVNHRQYDTKAFFANGPYAITATLETAVDGLYVFPFDVEIFEVMMFNIVAGSGGTTSLDVKRATATGSSFSTIFSTAPAIATTADHTDAAYIRTGGSGTGLTAPVLTTTPFNIDAGHAIRLDFLSKQTGSPQNCGLIIYMRPR
jgi:hypothetical protein